MSLQTLDVRDGRTLLTVARDSVRFGVLTGRAMDVDARRYSPALAAEGAAFVTLYRAGELRGCIGSLEARRPLIVDVALNAFAAASSDPRFPPVDGSEVGRLTVSVSVLGPAEALAFGDEADLLSQLRPGTDGVILQDGIHRGTFLPSVWGSLSDRRLFLEQLKRKAGLNPGYWSSTLRAYRYTVQELHE